ncbi:hypothetical protein [Pseudomonas mohnii]
MTRRITLNLDLNENDLDALRFLLASPVLVAKAVAPDDVREQSRIVDLLAEIAAGVAEAMGQTMADAIEKQVEAPAQGA